jgi:hypothetical protein
LEGSRACNEGEGGGDGVFENSESGEDGGDDVSRDGRRIGGNAGDDAVEAIKSSMMVGDVCGTYAKGGDEKLVEEEGGSEKSIETGRSDRLQKSETERARDGEMSLAREERGRAIWMKGGEEVGMKATRSEKVQKGQNNGKNTGSVLILLYVMIQCFSFYLRRLGVCGFLARFLLFSIVVVWLVVVSRFVDVWEEMRGKGEKSRKRRGKV